MIKIKNFLKELKGLRLMGKKKKQTHKHREQTVVVKKERGESGMDWESGVSKSKPLHLEWISNEVLLYSTGNYIQSLGINHDRI